MKFRWGLEYFPARSPNTFPVLDGCAARILSPRSSDCPRCTAYEARSSFSPELKIKLIAVSLHYSGSRIGGENDFLGFLFDGNSGEKRFAKDCSNQHHDRSIVINNNDNTQFNTNSKVLSCRWKCATNTKENVIHVSEADNETMIMSNKCQHELPFVQLKFQFHSIF